MSTTLTYWAHDLTKLHALACKWQRILGLECYRLDIGFDPYLPPGTSANVDVQELAIRVRVNPACPEDVESRIIHELMHALLSDVGADLPRCTEEHLVMRLESAFARGVYR